MRHALIYDTETTGLPVWKKHSGDPEQPHIVQLGALLVDLDTRKTAASIDLTVCPDGWTIPDEVTAIHGITTAQAEACGVPEPLALDCFMALWRQASVRIGHNQSFDARIIRIAQHRAGYDTDVLDEWKQAPAECTGLLAKPIIQMPPKGRYGYKMPKLTEAYEHFMGAPSYRQSHTAMADALDCMDVYFAIKTPDDKPQAASA